MDDDGAHPRQLATEEPAAPALLDNSEEEDLAALLARSTKEKKGKKGKKKDRARGGVGGTTATQDELVASGTAAEDGQAGRSEGVCLYVPPPPPPPTPPLTKLFRMACERH